MIMMIAAIGSGYFITPDLPAPPQCAPVVAERSPDPALNALLDDRSQVCWLIAADAVKQPRE